MNINASQDLDWHVAALLDVTVSTWVSGSFAGKTAGTQLPRIRRTLAYLAGEGVAGAVAEVLVVK